MMSKGMIRAMAAVPRVHLADPAANAAEIAALLDTADAKGAALCVFPELALTGASCGDLLLQPALQRAALNALFALTQEDVRCAFVVGLPLMMEGRLYNCAAVVCRGEIAIVPKEYADARLFAPGHTAPKEIALFGRTVPVGGDLRFDCDGFTFGVQVGDDLFAPVPPAAALCRGGALVIANPAASGEVVTRHKALCRQLEAQSAASVCTLVYAGAGCGESTTDMVYPGYAAVYEYGKALAENERFARGASFAIADADADRLAYKRAKYPALFTAESAVRSVALAAAADADASLRPLSSSPFIPKDDERAERLEEILLIQSQGLLSRMEHIHTQKLVLGVSGGLDSTLAILAAAYAYDRAGWPRSGIIGITMPGFGTGSRTKGNADKLMELIGCTQLTVPIGPAVTQHFADIGHDGQTHDVCYENSQARERTQIVMDYANKVGALALGTGDLSELALGWCTYNGDHMSMYNMNGTVPKSLIRPLVHHAAQLLGEDVLAVAQDIIDTPISPELIPGKEGELTQRTEDTLGAYALHDFFLYHMMDSGASPEKLFALALLAFDGQYSRAAMLNALRTFVRRFFTQQFKRSCMPDGAKIGSVSLSPRGDWRMPSDALMAVWMREVDALEA